MTVTRGTTNGNARGSTEGRRARRAWMMKTWASDIEGFVRCYRCGDLLFNSDDRSEAEAREVLRSLGWDEFGAVLVAFPLTIDRITPGCRGGTYRRNNIRPSCQRCASRTGGVIGSEQRSKTKRKAVQP